MHVSINMAAFHVLVLLPMSVRALESSACALRVCQSMCDRKTEGANEREEYE